MSIDEQNKNANQVNISGSQVGAANNYGTQTNTFGSQVNQTSQSGNNFNVPGNNNTVAGGNIDNSRQNVRIGGNVTGSNVVTGSNQTVHGNLTITMRDLTQTIQQGLAAPNEKETLQKLVDELKAALADVPSDQKAGAEKIAKRTEELVSEVSTDEPDKDGVEAKVNLLKSAAESVQEVMPAVFAIAMSIVTFGRQMVGM